MVIRSAKPSDLESIANVEAQCFPAADAAAREEFSQRIQYYGNHFWLLFEENRLVSFVDGFVTDKADLADDFRGEYPAGIPLPGICGAAAAKGDSGRKRAGQARPGFNLQRKADFLLRKVRFSG